jgi:hypothetical protein
MEFGRKITVLRNLVHRSHHPERSKITKLLGRIQNQSKRNVFAHAVVFSTPSTVTFVDRTRGGDYAATPHAYTLREFEQHVTDIMAIGAEFEQIIVPDHAEFQRFATAALRANTKSTKSPVPPSSKA